jgi:PAS domain S-box-containing protein
MSLADGNPILSVNAGSPRARSVRFGRVAVIGPRGPEQTRIVEALRRDGHEVEASADWRGVAERLGGADAALIDARRGDASKALAALRQGPEGWTTGVVVLGGDGAGGGRDDDVAGVDDVLAADASDGEIRAAVRGVVRAGRLRRESDERQAALVRSMPGAAVFVLDAEGRYVVADGEAMRAAGFTPESFVGKRLADVMPEERAARSRTLMERALAGGTFLDEHEVQGRAMVSRGVPLRDAHGRVEGVLVVSHDVTEVREAEKRAADLAVQRQLALDAARLGWWHYDPATGVSTWDRRMGEVFGVPAGTGPVETVSGLIVEEDRALAWGPADAALDPAKRARYEAVYRVRRPDGRLAWVECHGIGVFDGPGPRARAVALVGTAADVTGRIEAETALKASEERFRLASQAVTGIVFDWDVLGGRVWRSEGIRAVVGFDAAECDPTPEWWFERLHPDDRARAREQWDAWVRAEGGDHYEVGYRVKHRDGRYVPVWERGVVQRDASGRIVRVLGSTADMSQRLAAEAQARESEARLAMALEAGRLGFWDWHIPTGHVRFGGRWAAMLGYELESLTPHVDSWVKLVHPDDLAEATRLVQEHLDGRTAFYECEHRMLHADGSWRWILDRGQVVERDAEGRAVRAIGTHTDVTDRVEARERLARGAETARRLVEISPFGVYVVDADFRLAFVGEGARPAFAGITPLEGRDFAEIMRALWADRLAERAIAAFRRTLETGEAYHEPQNTETRRVDGRDMTYDWRVDRVTMPDGRYGVVCHFYDLTERAELETALRQREELLRTIVESTPDLVWAKDTQGRLTFANKAVADLFGATVDQIVGRTDMDFFGDKDLARAIQANDRRIMAAGRPELVEELVRDERGERVYETVKSPLRDEGGGVAGIVGVSREVTGSRRQARALACLARVSARLLEGGEPATLARAVFDELCGQLGAAVCFSFRFAEGGPAGEAGRGSGGGGHLRLIDCCGVDDAARAHYDRLELGAEVCGRTAQQRRQAYVPRLQESDDPAAANLRAAGLRCYVCTPLVSGDRLLGTLSVGWTDRDGLDADDLSLVTSASLQYGSALERALGEESLRESEDRFRSMVDGLPLIVWVHDAGGELRMVNRTYCEWYGISEKEVLGGGWRALIHPDDEAAYVGAWKGAVARREPFKGRCRVKDGRGRWRWIESWARPRWRSEEGGDGCGGGGRFMGFVGASADITETVEAQAALAEQEARFRTLANSMSNLAWVANPDGWITWYNDRWYAYTGTRPEEMVGWGWRSVHDPAWVDRVEAQFREAIATERVFEMEFPLRGADGRLRMFLTRAVPVRDGEGRIIHWFGTNTDVEEMRRAREALAASEARFRELADAMPQAVWVATPAGVNEYWNAKAPSIFGLPMEELIGGGWTSIVHPEDRERVAAGWAEAVRLGGFYECEYRARAPGDGAAASWRWTLARGEPVKDASGRIVRWLGTNTDIHDLKMAQAELALHRDNLERLVAERTEELRKSHERLRMSERMAALGTLSAGLGHDMGNLLMPVRVRLETLKAAGLPDELAKDVEAIRTSAEYLQRLSSGLRMLVLDPSRARSGEATDLATWWADAQGVLRSVLPRGVELAGDGGEPGVWALVARAALTQAVFNLVQNAGDALRDAGGEGGGGRGGGRVGIGWRRDGDQVRLTVRDNGPGMSPEVQRRCMEPFFSTKARGISTGMGLPLVYGLVQDAGGSVELESSSSGTSFTLVFPAAAGGGAERVAIGSGPGAMAGGNAAEVRVGDARLRSFITGELRALGYRVLTDHGAGQAVGTAGVRVLDAAAARLTPQVEQGEPAVVTVVLAEKMPIAEVRSLIRRELGERRAGGQGGQGGRGVGAAKGREP